MTDRQLAFCIAFLAGVTASVSLPVFIFGATYLSLVGEFDNEK